jgi:hypothetical protein
MPIEYEIDHARRLVIARGKGVFTDVDAFGYQRDVWSRPDVVGYDELVDMSAVEAISIPLPAGPRIQRLASTAAGQDPSALASKFAIVAPDSLAFGLGRQFQTYREMDARSTKEVAVFRTLPEALAFLGIDSLDRDDDCPVPADCSPPPTQTHLAPTFQDAAPGAKRVP